MDNGNGKLTAGPYGVVHLDEPRREPVFVVPSQAVFFNQDGARAAVYHHGTLQLRRLDLAADVEVRSLQPVDHVILNPPVDAVDGMRVAIASVPANVATKRSARS